MKNSGYNQTLIGKVFARLTVLKPAVVSSTRKRHYYMCKCSCGTVTKVRLDAILSGKTKSCGCLQKEVARARLRLKRQGVLSRNPQSIVGKKFERLTVLKLTGIERGTPLYECLCLCGNTSTVRGYSLLRGNTRSCGCLQKEAAATCGNWLPPGEAALNSLFRAYKTNAKRRNLDFTLTLDQFKMLTASICHYCGKPPSSHHKPKWSHSAYVYTGIDRVDNTKGYVPGNVEPSCKTCNVAKATLGYAEFITWAKRIAKRFIVLNEDLPKPPLI